MARILIVDDKEENLYLLRALLSGHGCEVDEARHGAEALIKARQSPPQLIISDLLMPVMDGYTLLRHWKADERLRQIPFVVYTATYTEPKDERLTLDLGADAFILKPAEPEPFMARIREVLAKEQRRELTAASASEAEEPVLLKQYSEVLVRKLEEKAWQLEQANRMLEYDITERKRTAEALRESEERYRTVSELISDYAYQFRVGPNDIPVNEWITGSFTHVVGLGLEEMRARGGWTKLVHADDWPMVQEHIQRVLSGGDDTCEFRFVTATGEARWVRNYARAMRDPAAGTAVRIYGAAQDITERKCAEMRVRASHEQLHELTHRLVAVEEASRRDLARELHDRVGQNLTALNLNLSTLKGVLPPELAERAGTRLEDSLRLVAETMDRVRDVMAELRPPVLDDYGLVAALRWHGAEFARRTGLRLEVRAAEPVARLPADVEIALFRIAQEALSNVARHAHAREVVITLEVADERQRLSISDDGAGFDSAAPRPAASWGLASMLERADAIGGRLRVQSAPGRGTMVTAELDGGSGARRGTNGDHGLPGR